MADSLAISVVIPTYRRPELLAQCLDGLRHQDVPESTFEVIVVDDASGPETTAVVEKAAHATGNVRSLTQPHNRGPAAARNRGVAASSAPLLLFLDDDIVASPSLVGTHVRLHSGTPDTYGLIGLVEWLPSLKVTHFMRWLDRVPNQFAFHTMEEGLQDDPAGKFYTCNLSMKRRLFDDVGGFDERFPFAAYEDTELAIRLIAKGFHLDYRKAALAWNSRAVTLDEFCSRMAKVAQSAHVLAEAFPGTDPFIADLAAPRYSNLQLALLRAVSVPFPTLLGRNLRSSYYWERVRRAYRDGLAAGRPASK
jgi:GT2 family glycosyltransferase